MAMFFSLFFLLITVLVIISFFRLGFLDWLLAFAVVAFAAIVFPFQIANLFHKINSIPTILGLQFIVSAVAFVGWWKGGRPKLFSRLPQFPSFRSLIETKANWPTLFLGGVVVGPLVIYAVLIYVVPPNNNDILSIHLARVANWLQSGSYFPWEAQNIRQVTFPVNAQLVYLWSMLFTRTDHFVGYTPFFSGLAIGLIVYKFARRINPSRKWALLAAFVWFSYPVIQLHLSSARHDLVSTWLFLSSLYFVYLWIKESKPGFMILSSMALALVVGTNLSIGAYLPGSLLIFLFLAITRQKTLRELATYALVIFAFFMLLTSPLFVSNQVHFGSPVGPDLDIQRVEAEAISQGVSVQQSYLLNGLRRTYQLVDFSGLPDFAEKLGVLTKARTIKAVSSVFHYDLEGSIGTLDNNVFSLTAIYRLQEDEAWFGVLGFAIILITSIAALFVAKKKKSWLLTVPFLFLITSLIFYSLIRPGWTPYDGRYFMPLAAICTPLIALWKPQKGQGWFIQIAIVLLSVSSVLMVILFNPAKQIVGGSAIWKMNRIDMLTRQSYNSKEMLYLVEAAIPPDAIVGVATNGVDYQEYGIFGEHFTRKVIEVLPGTELTDQAWLQQNQIAYLLILKTDDFPGQIAADYHFLDSKGDWMVYTNQP